MGLLDMIMGNAGEIPKEQLNQLMLEIGVSGEEVDCAFAFIRDKIVFTNKRLILINVQEITGKKVEYQSIPYKSISRFAFESAGTFDLDGELKLWISGQVEPSIVKEVSKKIDIKQLSRTLARYII